MKAIAIIPGKGNLQLVDQPEPEIVHPGDVKVEMMQVGICGTDRHQALGGNIDAPKGTNGLVIGHEMLGRVIEIGEEVMNFQPGDFGVFTVRRGCGKCYPCLHGRSDMCHTGEYLERGIKGLHGFQAERVVDHARYLVKVPTEIASLGVLTEPMSVVEKAIDEAEKIQDTRFPEIAAKESWLKGKRVLVAGLGAIGLLASFALRLRGAEVLGLDIVDEDSNRPKLFKEIGGKYIDGRTISTLDIDEHCGHIDLIFEATGVEKLGFELIDALGINGIYVLTGIPHGIRPVDITGANLMRQMVLKNQVLLGSVNASVEHYRLAIDDLEKAQETWPGAIKKVLTGIYPYAMFDEVLLSHPSSEIKTVLEWNAGATAN